MKIFSVGSLIKSLFLTLLAGLNFVVGSFAEAAELTTSETLVSHARESLKLALGDSYRLVPGSIEIADEALAVDLGNAIRSVIGAEQKSYRMDFRVQDLNGSKYRARARLLVSSLWSLDGDKNEDNNTALRGQDQGTGRLIRVQTQSLIGRPGVSSLPLSVSSLYLRKD